MDAIFRIFSPAPRTRRSSRRRPHSAGSSRTKARMISEIILSVFVNKSNIKNYVAPHRSDLLQAPAQVCQLPVPLLVQEVEGVAESARAQTGVVVKVFCKEET